MATQTPLFEVQSMSCESSTDTETDMIHRNHHWARHGGHDHRAGILSRSSRRSGRSFPVPIIISPPSTSTTNQTASPSLNPLSLRVPPQPPEGVPFTWALSTSAMPRRNPHLQRANFLFKNLGIGILWMTKRVQMRLPSAILEGEHILSTRITVVIAAAHGTARQICHISRPRTKKRN